MEKSKPKSPRPLCAGPSPRRSAPATPSNRPSPSPARALPPRPRPAVVPVLAELIARGDGTYVLRPRVPAEDLDTWVTIPQAGEIIGRVTAKSVYRLLGEYLVYRKPLRRKILVSLKSALALKQATQDADFWDNPELQERVKGQVRKIMDELTERAMKDL